MIRVRSCTNRQGFTLVELVVVVVMSVLCIGLLLPAAEKARENDVRIKSQKNLQEMGIASHNCAGANNNRLPNADIKDKKGAPSLSIMTRTRVRVRCPPL